MKKILVMLFIVSLLMASIMIVLKNKDYEYDRDIYSYMDRAIMTSNHEDMLSYIKAARRGMSKHDMISGNSAMIFDTVYGDMALYDIQMSNIEDRLKELKDIPKNSNHYNTALKDIRSVVYTLGRNIAYNVNEVSKKRYWYLPVIFLILSFPFAMLAAVAFTHMLTFNIDDKKYFE